MGDKLKREMSYYADAKISKCWTAIKFMIIDNKKKQRIRTIPFSKIFSILPQTNMIELVKKGSHENHKNVILIGNFKDATGQKDMKKYNLLRDNLYCGWNTEHWTNKGQLLEMRMRDQKGEQVLIYLKIDMDDSKKNEIVVAEFPHSGGSKHVDGTRLKETGYKLQQITKFETSEDGTLSFDIKREGVGPFSFSPYSHKDKLKYVKFLAGYKGAWKTALE